MYILEHLLCIGGGGWSWSMCTQYICCWSAPLVPLPFFDTPPLPFMLHNPSLHWFLHPGCHFFPVPPLQFQPAPFPVFNEWPNFREMTSNIQTDILLWSICFLSSTILKHTSSHWYTFFQYSLGTSEITSVVWRLFSMGGGGVTFCHSSVGAPRIWQSTGVAKGGGVRTAHISSNTVIKKITGLDIKTHGIHTHTEGFNFFLNERGVPRFHQWKSQNLHPQSWFLNGPLWNGDLLCC